MEESPPARLIKKVVIGYDLNALPPSIIRSFTRLRGKMTRKKFKIEVVMRPLARLPPDTDVLFVPAELMETARQVAPAEARVEPLNASTTQQPAFEALVEQLEIGREICALRLEKGAEQPSSQRGVIMRYRGRERIG